MFNARGLRALVCDVDSSFLTVCAFFAMVCVGMGVYGVMYTCICRFKTFTLITAGSFSMLAVVLGVFTVIQSLSLCCMQTPTLGGISEEDWVTVK